MSQTTTSRLDRQQVGLLVSVLLTVFIALLDVNIVTVALPAIQTDLQGGVETMQWVVNAYTLCIAALALSSGSLADRYGRKRVFIVGLVLFTAGSAVCAFAPSAALLVGGRFLQGIGAAVTVPGTLSLIAQGFPDPARRARVIGWWSFTAGLAAIIGPVLGGALVDAFGWSSIFLINLPIGAVAILAAVRGVSESKDPDHAALDPVGQVLCVVWLAALIYALINAGARGWGDATTIVPLAVAVAGLVAFLAVEARQGRPMLPLSLLRHPPFAVTNVASLLLGFSVLASLFFLPLYLQQVRGLTATGAGLLLLPMPIGSTLASLLAGRLTARAGTRVVMMAGYTISAAGLAGLALLQPDSGLVLVGAVFAVLGVGGGLALTPTNAAAFGSVPIQRSGTAAATVNAARQTGTSLGIALLGSLFSLVGIASLRSSLAGAGTPPAQAGTYAQSVIDDRAIADVAGRTGLGAARVESLYHEAFLGGLHTVGIVAALAALVAAVLVTLVRSARPADG